MLENKSIIIHKYVLLRILFPVFFVKLVLLQIYVTQHNKRLLQVSYNLFDSFFICRVSVLNLCKINNLITYILINYIMQQIYTKPHTFNRNRSNPNKLKGIDSKSCKQSLELLQTLQQFYHKKSIETQKLLENAESNPQEDQQISLNKKLFPDGFEQKCYKLLEDLCMNVQLFKKVSSNTRRKKTVMSRLYGWDQQFKIIFNKEELAENINPRFLYDELGLGKRSFKSKNIYNKLRLFLQQLRTYNLKQQELQFNFQRTRLVQSLGKLQTQLSQINSKKKIKKGTSSMMHELKTTRTDMINKMIKIKNKKQDINRIELASGPVKINRFYYQQEHNLAEIENLLKKKIM